MKRLVFLATMAVAMLTAMAQGNSFSGGNGSSSAPYQIATATDLQILSRNVGNGMTYDNVHFILTADIDLSAIRGGSGWQPIGTYNGTGFAGTLDGAGHTVSRLYIKSTADGQGLFGYISSGTVKDVVVDGCDVSGNNYVGGIVGYNNGTVNGCTVKNGKIYISGSLGNGGAIAGSVYHGTISDCKVSWTAITAGNSNIGGICGSVYNAKVTGCSVTSTTFTGGTHKGAIIGYNEGGSLMVKDNLYSDDVTGVTGSIDSNPSTAEAKPQKKHKLGRSSGTSEKPAEPAPVVTSAPAVATVPTVTPLQPQTITSVEAATPKQPKALASSEQYIVKTKGVKKPVATVKTERPKSITEEPEATDFMGKNFRFYSMCDWKEGMRFMVVPEKYNLLVNTFRDAKTNKEVSSGILRHKIMVFKGHSDMPNGRVHINFYCEDDKQDYYYELPNGTFEDYCWSKMGVPTLAYLADVDKARELLMGKILLTRTQFFRVDTEYDGDGFKEVTVDKNKAVTVKAVGVGTRSFPVKIIVEDENGNQFYQCVAMSKTNSGLRDDEFTLDNEKYQFQGSFELGDVEMEVSENAKDYLGKTVYTKIVTSMSSKGSGKVRDVKVPRFTGFIIDEIIPVKGSHLYTLTLRETESRRIYYKDIFFKEDDIAANGNKEDFFGHTFGLGEGVARSTSKETRAAIREGRVIRGMSKEEVEMAMGEPISKLVDSDGNDKWLYNRSNGVILDVWFDAKGYVKQAKARQGNGAAAPSTNAMQKKNMRSTKSSQSSASSGTPLK